MRFTGCLLLIITMACATKSITSFMTRMTSSSSICKTISSTAFSWRNASPSSSSSLRAASPRRQASASSAATSSTTCATTITAAEDQEKIIQNVLHRIRTVNSMPQGIRSSLLDFKVDGMTLGKVRPKIAHLLCSSDKENPAFCVADDDRNGHQSSSYLTLTVDAGNTMESRTESVNRIMKRLRDQGVVEGWRDEDYPVRRSFYEETLFGVERAAASLLGIMEYGVHINGIVQEEQQGGGGTTNGGGPTTTTPKMWIARRAPDKSKYPGMLDHIVAGGQPVGLSLMENVVKECEEEAGVPEDLTRAGIQSAGAISYETYSPLNDCVTRCVLFCYDLHLPPDFIPKPVDGEVEEFFLWDMDQIKASMDPDYPDPIKPNCYPVIIDYMIRNGHLPSDTKGYLDVLRELRSGDCF